MCIIQGKIIENKNTAWREACKLLAMRCFCLLKDHEKGSGRDKQDSDQFFDGDLLMQEKKSQDDGEHDAELVYGHHLGGFPHLQRLVIADPGGAGSKAGKNQENPAFPADIGKTALGIGHEYDDPCHNHDHDGPDRGSQVGIDAFDPHFCEYGGQGGKNR